MTAKVRYSLLSLRQCFKKTSPVPNTLIFMAGLQQYNFFPTDLLYPRPQPSTTPAVLPLQAPKPQTTPDLHLQNQPSGFIKVPPYTSSALVSSQKAKSPLEVDKKLSQLSTDPLSLLIWVAEEEGSDTC